MCVCLSLSRSLQRKRERQRERKRERERERDVQFFFFSPSKIPYPIFQAAKEGVEGVGEEGVEGVGEEGDSVGYFLVVHYPPPSSHCNAVNYMSVMQILDTCVSECIFTTYPFETDSGKNSVE